MAQRVPPNLEPRLGEYRKMLDEYESYSATATLWENQVSELGRTLEELGKQPDDVATYKVVGQVMFRVEKSKIMEEMQTEKEEKERSLATLKRKIETKATKIKEKHDELQVELGKQNLRLP
jgi:chaperonin cofactor prefoldin